MHATNIISERSIPLTEGAWLYKERLRAAGILRDPVGRLADYFIANMQAEAEPAAPLSLSEQREQTNVILTAAAQLAARNPGMRIREAGAIVRSMIAAQTNPDANAKTQRLPTRPPGEHPTMPPAAANGPAGFETIPRGATGAAFAKYYSRALALQKINPDWSWKECKDAAKKEAGLL